MEALNSSISEAVDLENLPPQSFFAMVYLLQMIMKDPQGEGGNPGLRIGETGG